MIEHILVSKDVAKTRFEICNNCDKLINPVKVCKLCGCFVLAKITLAKSYCPQQKWMPAEQDVSINK